MIQLKLTNYRRIKSADIKITDLTLLAGLNEEGKSSMAQAAGSLLTGTILPDDIPKKDCGMIINDSARSAIIQLIGDNGSATIGFPECNSIADGIAPKSSEVAVGFKSPSSHNKYGKPDMNMKERSKYFSDLLGLLPEFTDLFKALPDMDNIILEALWKQINISGWDVTHDQAKKKGAELKSFWKKATGGDTYGKLKVESWQPEGYDRKMTADHITTRLAELKKQHENDVGKQAIDDAEKTRLTGLAVYTEDAREAHMKASNQTVKLLEERNALYTGNAPVLLSKEGEQKCPGCNIVLIIKDDKICKSDGITNKDITDSQKKLIAYQKKIKTAEEKYNESSLASDETQRILNECEAAQETLDKSSDNTDDGTNLEKKNDEIAVLMVKKDAIKQYSDARSIHEKILSNETIVKVLAPDGLRKKFLSKGMSGFRESLNKLSAYTEYGVVSIDDDMNILYNKRPNSTISGSAKFRRDLLIQLVCAKIDGSNVVVIDGADILDLKGLYGLSKAVKYIGIPALVCATMDKREDMPDMSAIGGGSYWIEGGEIL